MGLMDIFQAFSLAATARKGRKGQAARGGGGVEGEVPVGQLFQLVFLSSTRELQRVAAST